MTLLSSALSTEIVTDRLRIRDLETRPGRRPSGLGARHCRQRDRQLVDLEMVTPGAPWHVSGWLSREPFPPQPMVARDVLVQHVERGGGRTHVVGGSSNARHADAAKRRSATFVDLLALVVQR